MAYEISTKERQEMAQDKGRGWNVCPDAYRGCPDAKNPVVFEQLCTKGKEVTALCTPDLRQVIGDGDAEMAKSPSAGEKK